MKKLESLKNSKFKNESLNLKELENIIGGECQQSGCNDSSDHIDITNGQIDGYGGGDCCSIEGLGGASKVSLTKTASFSLSVQSA